MILTLDVAKLCRSPFSCKNLIRRQFSHLFTMNQVTSWKHTEHTSYRCFLSDLAGFEGLNVVAVPATVFRGLSKNQGSYKIILSYISTISISVLASKLLSIRLRVSVLFFIIVSLSCMLTARVTFAQSPSPVMLSPAKGTFLAK